MKVIAKQAKGKELCNRWDVSLIHPHEVGVILFLEENIRPIHAAIVDVII
jgi:hypothetical protein